MNEFDNIAKLQNQTLDVINEEMVKNLRINRSMATGQLARSIGVTDTIDENGTLKGVLEIKTWYAELVDQGIDNRGPGKQPPVRPIQEWLKRKSISIPSGVTIEQYSYAIAKKIGKRGQRKRAYPFIEPSIKEGEAFFNNKIEKALIEDVAINTTEILDSSPYLKPVR